MLTSTLELGCSGNPICYSEDTSLQSLVLRTTVTAAGFFLATNSVFAQADETSRSWNKPVTPFRIAGNLYYVGAVEITSYLITTPEGHFLLDGGFVETAPQIERNIAELGFKLTDVKFLLNSHAHYDHAGGLAELKKVTGAKIRGQRTRCSPAPQRRAWRFSVRRYPHLPADRA